MKETSEYTSVDFAADLKTLEDILYKQKFIDHSEITDKNFSTDLRSAGLALRHAYQMFVGEVDKAV